MDGHTDEHSRKHRKDIGLNQRHENFKQIDRQRKRHGDESDGIHLEEENKTEDRQNYYVARGHVRKESDTECERLRKQTDELDRDQNQSNGKGKPSRYKILPLPEHAIVNHPTDLRHDEGTEGETRGDANVAGCRGTVGNQSQKITG